MLGVRSDVGLSVRTSPKISSYGCLFWKMSLTPGAWMSTLTQVATDPFLHGT